MTTKGVLLHVANPSMLTANALMFDSNLYAGLSDERKAWARENHSQETHHLTKRFVELGFDCYWYVLKDDDVDPLHLRDVFSVSAGRRLDLPVDQLNARVELVVVRVLGSVEAKVAKISRYLLQLQEKFAGRVLNDPTAMRYGMRKDYLLEFADAGYPTPPTMYFPSSVGFEELASRYRGVTHSYIIKPVTGELSNSFAVLSDYNEKILRWKESKVGGWLVQPIMPEIWSGEYQLFFIGDKFINATQKKYLRRSSAELIPSQKARLVTPYEPLPSEIELGQELHTFWRSRFGLRSDYYRFDFFRRADGQPIVLEFEVVNPGFYIDTIDGEHRSKIVDAFVSYAAQARPVPV